MQTRRDVLGPFVLQYFHRHHTGYRRSRAGFVVDASTTLVWPKQ
jgi:hypothetical protein